MNLQDVANLTIPEGEVKMIHDKNRKLLWGRLSYDTTYRGDTFQQIYSGKNLMNYATYDADNGRIMNMPNLVLPVGTFTISFDLDSFKLGTSNNANLFLYLIDENNHSTFSDGSGSQIIMTIDSSTQLGRYSFTFETKEITHHANSNIRMAQVAYNNGARCKITNIQIESGSTPTTYEPYVGVIPAPSPDYPQDVNVVTGEQTIGIHGKNIFDTYSTTVYSPGTYGDVSNNNGVITTTVNGRAHIGDGFIVPVPVEPGETYCISAKLVEATSTYNYKGTLDVRTVVPGGRGARVRILNFTSLGTFSRDFVVPDGVTEIWVSFMSYEVDNYSVFSDVQIEKGSSATSFEPGTPHSYTVNLGSTELCKVGDYQDYIYKSGNDWYVHKETGKVTYNGSENWKLSNHSRCAITKPSGWDTWGVDTSTYPSKGYSTHLLPGNSETVNNSFNVGGTNVFVRSPGKGTGGTSIDTWKTWLTSNNITIYSILATPTNTQITDSTLIGQLNAIHQFLTRYGYNFSVGGDLPIIINQGGLT